MLPFSRLVCHTANVKTAQAPINKNIKSAKPQTNDIWGEEDVKDDSGDEDDGRKKPE